MAHLSAAPAGRVGLRHSIAEDADWIRLRSTVDALRTLQHADGSIDFKSSNPGETAGAVDQIVGAIAQLARHVPHDAHYLDTVAQDLRQWQRNNFGVPDFARSLSAFHPEQNRTDGRLHVIVFPMYTQNGTAGIHLEALLVVAQWPGWLADLERGRYDNTGFVPMDLLDYTAGYDNDAAVLFPETVAAHAESGNLGWGIIFCDREALRFRRICARATRTLRIELPDQALHVLNDQDAAHNAFMLWDMLHDRSHSRGYLPFDPFMIKQRNPFWMYAIEELRCDLNALEAVTELADSGNPLGTPVAYTILLDRMLRFPITGPRTGNYDGLAGQLLFAYLRGNGALRWQDNQLSFERDPFAEAAVLLSDINALYFDGIDRSKPAHWLAAHRFISQHVAPHPRSVWAKGPSVLPFAPAEPAPRQRAALCDAALADEFPLSMFYEALARKLSPSASPSRTAPSRSDRPAEQV